MSHDQNQMLALSGGLTDDLLTTERITDKWIPITMGDNHRAPLFDLEPRDSPFLGNAPPLG